MIHESRESEGGDGWQFKLANEDLHYAFIGVGTSQSWDGIGEE